MPGRCGGLTDGSTGSPRRCAPRNDVKSEIAWLQARALGNTGKHAGTNFITIMKGKHKIGPSQALYYLMRSAPFSLDLPSDTLPGPYNLSSLARWPFAHEAEANTSLISGTSSPCSNRSASTRRASAFTFAVASSKLEPYPKTPGKSTISANQRPSSSCSVSIESFIFSN